MHFRTRLISLAVMAALCGGSLAAFKPTPEPVSPDGTAATIDIPAARHIRNVGGSDGAGLCVFTSVQHSADWQNVRSLDGFREWMRSRPGGGWPQKLDQMIAAYSRAKGVSPPDYIQHTGGDESFLELSLKTDRFPAVTYDGRDNFYSGQIAHMVNLAHLDESRAAIIDNNRPGSWVWMTRGEFLSRWRGNSGGWAVVLLADPPPPHAEPVKAFGAGCVCGDSCSCAKGDCPAKCPVSFGQCPGGKCGVPSQPFPLPAPAQYPARPFPPAAPAPTVAPALAGGGAVLTASGRWIAPHGDGTYRYVDPPAVPVASVGDNFGVSPDRIHSHPHYTINGVQVDREAARAALGAKGLADDSNHWHLTAVGDAAALKAFAADVSALPSEVRGKLLVQAYPPDGWPVALYKLPAGVSLRRPSPGRTAPEVGSVPSADYSAAKLAALLAMPGGPTWKPAPVIPPTPVPPPAPLPVGPDPLGPLAPVNPPAPNPAQPAPPPRDWSVWVIGGILLFAILARKKV